MRNFSCVISMKFAYTDGRTISIVQKICCTDTKRVRDPATRQEFYFGWKKLCPNTAAANVIKIFFFMWAWLILFPAYLTM